jgi:hypothetical protein
MTLRSPVSRILSFVALGFFVIIALSWFNELTGLKAFVRLQTVGPNWWEAAIETLIVLVVAVPVLLLMRRLLKRLHYLEGFVRVCAWCKKAELDGEWISMDEFFEKKFATKTSHGICNECSDLKSEEIKNRVPADQNRLAAGKE